MLKGFTSVIVRDEVLKLATLVRWNVALGACDLAQCSRFRKSGSRARCNISSLQWSEVEVGCLADLSSALDWLAPLGSCDVLASGTHRKYVFWLQPGWRPRQRIDCLPLSRARSIAWNTKNTSSQSNCTVHLHLRLLPHGGSDRSRGQPQA